MRKLFALLFLGLIYSGILEGQVVISGDFAKKPECEIKIKLVDSVSNNPLEMATVYLQPKGDTNIMYFNLTDTAGTAVLSKVVRGNYKLTAEFMGYKPYVKEYYFNKNKEDLGICRLAEDVISLDAATISAIGNPIEIIKDTIIYNATMFKTADNAVLGELLKKMPGFEVSESGMVKINGQSVSKITVNGRTFFFGDLSMAVKNLPAKIVEKIKITDHKSDTEKNTGIADMGRKNNEMDIALKKEYEHGWFGNTKIAAGTPVAPDKNKNQQLITQKDILYNGNAMVSGYNEKDQLTILVNGYNVDNSGANEHAFYYYNSELSNRRRTRPNDGVTEAMIIGANLNTSRINNFDATATTNYKRHIIVSEKYAERRTFTGNSDVLNTTRKSDSEYDDHLLDVNLELKNKNTKKVYFRIAPKFNFTQTHQVGKSYFETKDLNSSNAKSYREDNYFQHQTDFNITLKNILKSDRSIALEGDWFICNEDAREKEFSETLYKSTGNIEIRDLNYENYTKGFGYNATLTYVEPLSTNWSLSAALKSNLNVSNYLSDAFNDNILNDYYSSVSDYRYFANGGTLLAQFKKGMKTFQIGGSGEAVNNENYSKSFGISQLTGKNEYVWNWSPFLKMEIFSKKGALYNFSYKGTSANLTNAQITTVPIVSNPIFVKLGNIYLEPSFTNSLVFLYAKSNRKTFSSLQAFIGLNHSADGIANANWFDSNGVQYYIPVNSKKTNMDVDFEFNWSNIPLIKDKSLALSISSSVIYGIGHSYQNITEFNCVDLDKFNYSDFMNQLWGNAEGDKFYSGQSGFKESQTTKLSASVNADLHYKHDAFSAKAGANIKKELLDYSLNKGANINLWNYTFKGQMQYDTKSNMNLITQLEYNLYDGYMEGYGKPSLLWNMEMHKNIKSITLSLYLRDILNQANGFIHTATANYIEDGYRNIIGRRIMAGITINFGKMNSAKSRSARTAIGKMML